MKKKLKKQNKKGRALKHCEIMLERFKPIYITLNRFTVCRGFDFQVLTNSIQKLAVQL